MKRVLITGANKGVGLATVAAVLAARDDTAVWLGSRDRDRGVAARDELLREHPSWADRVEVLEIDVSDDGSVRDAAATARAAHGSAPGALYGIVNNAGIGASPAGLAAVLDVNLHGTRRVCDAFLPLLAPGTGRVVNVASASGPNYVAATTPARRRVLTDPAVTWDQLEALIAEAGGESNHYGLSKACVNAYTMLLAREQPELVVNACTPGFIETDMTRPYAAAQGVAPSEMGMKAPSEGTRAQVHLLFGEVGGSGWYFGSDAQRSPLDRYRSPGAPPYDGR